VLRVFNDDIVEAHKGFDTHPHEEMEIVSIVLDGEMVHKDTMGNETVIRKNDVQRMTAGIGLYHSEQNMSDHPVHFFQIWINPDKKGWEEGNPVFEKNWEEMLKSGAMGLDQRDWFLNATNSLYNWNSDANLAFAVKNTGFFAMSLMYAATSLGLETHPMDGFDHEAVRKEFKIPDNYWIPLLLAVGYKKEGVELLPAKWRKMYNEIVVTF